MELENELNFGLIGLKLGGETGQKWFINLV